MTTRRGKREVTEEFKKQMVPLYNSGKSEADTVALPFFQLLRNSTV